MNLKRAIEEGNVEAAKRLLDEDPSLAARPIPCGPLDQSQAEPLHYISDRAFEGKIKHQRQAELAVLLLEAGAPVEGTGENETLLHGAVSLGQDAVAMVLLDYGADIEAIGRYPGIPDGTPLDFAVHFGMTDCVDMLVQRGAKIKTPRMAAGAGRLDLLKQMEVTSPTDILRTAAVCDQTHVVDWLLQSQLEPNANINGATALHWAAWEGKSRMVKFLLERGADPSRRDDDHNLTALGWAKYRRKTLGAGWGHDEVIALPWPDNAA
ncbi:MAG: ankyrin repeat domain-containing protein [Phycisphaerae bacterium]